MDNKDNSVHLGPKHARIFVLGQFICSSKLTEQITSAYFCAKWRLFIYPTNVLLSYEEAVNLSEWIIMCSPCNKKHRNRSLGL